MKIEPTSEQKKDFLAYAEQIGHDRQTLLKTGSHTTTVTLNNIAQFRELVRPIQADVRATRQANIEAEAKGRALTVEENVQAYLFGNGELSDQHRAICDERFPSTVNLVSVESRTMPHGEFVIGPSAPPTVWNYLTLNFYNDSYLTVKSTYFTLNVQNLVMQYTDA